MLKQFKLNYCVSNVYRLFHHLGFSWITSSSRHPKQSYEINKVYEKLEIIMIP
ncbi:winged helix-turn-helix domain-containing protein [Thalassotalea piscium]|uniref:winged helix-turn-helix domain-containing protein n=1 Tax=Thalassotalea piscium TaxID=1230533 RepID=UPI00161005DE